MKILYGVQGTGNGHISRARMMAKHFSTAPVEIDYLFSGRAREQYFEMEEFGQFRSCNGLTFTVENGRVRYLRTVFNNGHRQFLTDLRSLEVEGYDLILTDFEPLTAWAGKRAGKVVIGLGHQPAFRYPVPRRGLALASLATFKYFAPADIHLGMHWHHFGQPILPPIVRTTDSPVTTIPGKILVYLPFEKQQSVVNMLEKFPGFEFYIYSPVFLQPVDRKNIHLRPVSVKGFHQDMHSCEGVICNAGFETTSECLQLGKKVLVKPLRRQMEQLSNAYALEQLGLGMSMKSVDARVVSRWLQSDKQERSVTYPDVAKAIVDWVIAGNWQDVEGLAVKLWRETRFSGFSGISNFHDLHSF